MNKNVNKKQIIRDLIAQWKIDALLITSEFNRFWYTSFQSTAGYLLITKDKTFFFLDGRYITDGKNNAKNIDEFIEFKSLDQIKTILEDHNYKHLGFEKQYLTYGEFERFSKQITNKLYPIDVSRVRIIKSDEEINKIKKACEIGDETFNIILKHIKPGMTEKEVDAMINGSFMHLGAEKASFDSIVAAGERSALPHGRASERILKENEIITCDFGCIYQGYCSDMTRTFVLGKEINPALERIYNIVKEAQELGIRAIKPGVRCSEIDEICRNFITVQGYGEYFSHGTGHGLGIEVHETPYVSKNDDSELKPGMVITVEPGIYIPGVGGVRIEDDVLVTDTGYEVLTKAEKNLIYTEKKQNNKAIS